MIIDLLPCLPDMQDEVLVTKDHPVVLSVAAPKEVRKNGQHRNKKTNIKTKTKIKIADVEGACQGTIGLEPY